jgi:hypothetical protein
MIGVDTMYLGSILDVNLTNANRVSTIYIHVPTNGTNPTFSGFNYTWLRM